MIVGTTARPAGASIGPMRPELLDRAAELIAPLLAGDRPRTMVGLAGPPGAGKSTLAEAIARRFNREPALPAPAAAGPAVAIPMDGFHLSQVELRRLGLANRKGAPETFDSYGFVHLLRRLREAKELVYAPEYSRTVHESIGSSIPVFPTTRLIVIEGNYLLLPDEPWNAVPPLLDLTIFVEAPHTDRVRGLVRRQRTFGLGDDAARDWVERSDEANARLVEASRGRADVVLSRT
jgi:pantothenate kinase